MFKVYFKSKRKYSNCPEKQMSVTFTIIGIIKTDISFYFHNPEEQIKNK